ncbi:BON1-associated protein 1-like [Cornus florida]|uniref:BON1-associated protein 1-like n=1 Tax=Cornus florida TaxID=4283 RepID=UPI00289DE38A|nr:BON1-associated protein 1-like [Cornus florida]
MLKNNHQPLMMEITVKSAEGLKNTSSKLFSSRLRPFITLSTVPPFSQRPINGDKHGHVCKTRVDDQGGINPTWGDKFQLPIDATFLYQRHSRIYLQLYTKSVMVGQTQLGWCYIPTADVVDGMSPVGSVRHLSYRLRERDGSRGHGIVNIAVKLEGSLPVACPHSDLTHLPEMGWGQTVIGFPVTMFPEAVGESQSRAMSHGQFIASCNEGTRRSDQKR